MIGLWLVERQLRLRNDLAVPVVESGQASIRVRLAGICTTDLELTRGYYSFTGVPGHEFVGEIAAAADAPQRIGERVVGEINVGCGACAACQRGQCNHCERREVLGIRGRHGAFAQYLTLPLANLHRVPDAIADESAVFCEPLAAAFRIQSQRLIVSGERVLLIGAGRLGQLIARTLPQDCQLTVVARHARQRRLLESSRIAWVDETSVYKRSFDLVIEASGSPSGFALACRSVRPGGTIALKSTYAGPAQAELSQLVVDEITLIGSRCGAFAPTLNFLAQGSIDPRPLIEARYPLTNAVDAFEHAARPGALKVILDCR